MDSRQASWIKDWVYFTINKTKSRPQAKLGREIYSVTSDYFTCCASLPAA